MADICKELETNKSFYIYIYSECRLDMQFSSLCWRVQLLVPNGSICLQISSSCILGKNNVFKMSSGIVEVCDWWCTGYNSSLMCCRSLSGSKWVKCACVTGYAMNAMVLYIWRLPVGPPDNVLGPVGFWKWTVGNQHTLNMLILCEQLSPVRSAY